MDQWVKRLESETRAKRSLEDELSSVKKELSQSQTASKSLLQDSSARQELQQKYDQLGREYSRALDKIETLEDQIASKCHVDFDTCQTNTYISVERTARARSRC